ncbi:hypothetical protein EDB89DRAFT_1190323 [Lactarius sanguifluus]|nr:hypothetical protein EDB89DRAFT_1190323 [Lactarius sanguifluus]
MRQSKGTKLCSVASRLRPGIRSSLAQLRLKLWTHCPTQNPYLLDPNLIPQKLGSAHRRLLQNVIHHWVTRVFPPMAGSLGPFFLIWSLSEPWERLSLSITSQTSSRRALMWRQSLTSPSPYPIFSIGRCSGPLPLDGSFLMATQLPLFLVPVSVTLGSHALQNALTFNDHGRRQTLTRRSVLAPHSARLPEAKDTLGSGTRPHCGSRTIWGAECYRAMEIVEPAIALIL